MTKRTSDVNNVTRTVSSDNAHFYDDWQCSSIFQCNLCVMPSWTRTNNLYINVYCFFSSSSYLTFPMSWYRFQHQNTSKFNSLTTGPRILSKPQSCCRLGTQKWLKLTIHCNDMLNFMFHFIDEEKSFASFLCSSSSSSCGNSCGSMQHSIYIHFGANAFNVFL